MKAQILIFDNINLHTPENGEQPNTQPVATYKTPDATNGVLDAAASLLTEGASGQYAGIVLRKKSTDPTTGEVTASDTGLYEALLGELETLGAPKKPYVTPSYAITVGEKYSKPQILEIPQYGYFAARIFNGFNVRTSDGSNNDSGYDLFMLTSIFPVSIGEEEKTLNLNNQNFKGEILNLNIEAQEAQLTGETWYKATGLELGKDEISTYLFTPYTSDYSPPEKSVAIREGYKYEEKVSLLYNAGIITGEKTDSYTTSSLNMPGASYTYYRLTNQAIEYANRMQGTNGGESMKEIDERHERKKQENNKHLPKRITQELKYLIPTSDDYRISEIEKHLAELENRMSTLPSQEGANAQAEQEEEYPRLRLKNHEWRGREINLYIEAKQPYPNYNPWYDITGYYTCGGEEIQFSQYTFDFFRYRDSAAIDMWEDHDKIVRLLYNAGVITKEKTYTSIGLEKKCICYRLTDQALAYAHREQ